MKSKKNIKSIFILAIISIFSLFFLNKSFAIDTAKVSVETANLRAEANATSTIVELISKGEEVQILEKSGEWYKVKYKNYTGYLRKDLLDETQQVSATVENNSNTENAGTTSGTENASNENVSNENTNNENQNTGTQENTENVNAVDTALTADNTASEENSNSVKGTYKVTQNESLRITPLITSLELAQLPIDANVEVVSAINDWAWLTTSDGIQGWARIGSLEKTENVAEEKQETEAEDPNKENEENQEQQEQKEEKAEQQTQTKYVSVQTANLRDKGDKAGALVTQLQINTEVTVMSEENGWAYVEVNGKKGYISTSLLSTTKQETSRSLLNSRETTTTTASTAKAATPTDSGTSSGTGSSVVSYANQFIGCRYVYGGTTTAGFDCSGFTQFVYKNFGVNLNRTAAAQYSNGTAVTDLQAGDLVMFGKSGINHVGIYIGGGTFIHAANPSKGVTTDSLNSGYYNNNYVGARRILQ